MKKSKLLVVLLCLFACTKTIDFTDDSLVILKSSHPNKTSTLESYNLNLKLQHSKKIKRTALGLQTLPVKKYQNKIYDIAYDPNNNQLLSYDLTTNELTTISNAKDYPQYKKIINNWLFYSANALTNNTVEIIDLQTNVRTKLSLANYFINELEFNEIKQQYYLFVTNNKTDQNELFIYDKNYQLQGQNKIVGQFNANSNSLLVTDTLYYISETNDKNYLNVYHSKTKKTKRYLLSIESPSKIIKLNQAIYILNYDTISGIKTKPVIMKIDQTNLKNLNTNDSLIDLIEKDDYLYGLSNTSLIKYTKDFRMISKVKLDSNSEDIIGFVK